MTLSSRHRIRNSSPGGLRPGTLPLGHGGSPQYWLSHVDGEETFLVSFKPPRPGTEPRTLAWKAAVLTTTLGPPPKPLPVVTVVRQYANSRHCSFQIRGLSWWTYLSFSGSLMHFEYHMCRSLVWIDNLLKVLLYSTNRWFHNDRVLRTVHTKRGNRKPLPQVHPYTPH